MPTGDVGLDVTLQQIDNLRQELIKTEKVIRDSSLGKVSQHVMMVLDNLARSPIPYLVNEIDYTLRTSGFNNNNPFYDDTTIKTEEQAEDGQMEINNMKEEIIRADDYDDEEISKDFKIFTDQEDQEAEQNNNPRNSEASSDVEESIEFFVTDDQMESTHLCWPPSKIIDEQDEFEIDVKEEDFIDEVYEYDGNEDPFQDFQTFPEYFSDQDEQNLLLNNSGSDLAPLPFVFQQSKEPAAVVNLPYKCPHCSNSYNNETSLQWHLIYGSRMNFNEQLAHKGPAPFIITCGSTRSVLQESLRLFSNLCLKVPGTKEALMGFKNSNGNFVCPLCVPEKILLSKKVSDFMRHIIARDHATLIPLPYIRQAQEASDRKILECESEGDDDEEEQFQGQLELNTRKPNDKMLSNVIKESLAVPGVKERLVKFRNSSNTGYDCPSCPHGTLKLRDTWGLMRHIVRMHKDSDLIPLPYIKQVKQRQQPSSTTSKKRKRSKSPDECSSDEEELSTSTSFEDANDPLNELM